MTGDLANFNFDLVPQACINGRVIDPAGNGVAGVDVNFGSEQTHVHISATTDVNGEYTICNLPAGIGGVNAEPDFIPPAPVYCQTTDKAVYLNVGDNRNISPIRLKRCAVVIGSVDGPSLDSGCGLEIRADGIDFNVGADVQADQSYHAFLPEGTHRIYLDPSGRGPWDPAAYPVTVTVTATDVTTGGPVPIPDSMTIVAAGDLDAATISGSIENTTGASPAGNTFVSLFPQGMVANATPETLANIGSIQEALITLPLNGTVPFSLTPVPPGVYDIVLFEHHELASGIEAITILDSFTVGEIVGGGAGFNLPNPLVYTSGSPQVDGYIQDSRGSPILAATVLVTDSIGNFVAFTRTDETGHYTLYNLPDGTFTVQAVHPDFESRPTTTVTLPGPTTIDLLTLDYVPQSAVPGIEIFDSRSGVITWTTNSDSPSTGLVLEVKIIDYDGIAGDGSSHTVTVTYPNGTTRQLNFSSRINSISAYYEDYDGLNLQPADYAAYSGDYVFRVTDSDGDWSEAVDNVQVAPVTPPDENTFTPILDPPQSIRTFFDDVCAYDINGTLIDCDDFSAGYDAGIWQPPPADAYFENGEVRFEQGNILGRRSTWLNLQDPTGFAELKATIRVDANSTDLPKARIGGNFCNVDGSEVFASIGIRRNEAVFDVAKDRWEGDHLIDDAVVPTTSLGPVTAGNRYDVFLKWDDAAATFTFRVVGLDDTVNYSTTYTVAGQINPADNPWKAIGIASWLEIGTTTPTFNWDTVPGATYYRVRVYGFNDNTIYRGYTSTPPFDLPPGILKPNAVYKYRIDAIRDHQWFEWDNGGRSDPNLTYFITRAAEAQQPTLDLWGSGVRTFNYPPPYQAYASFYVRVHDAQGVPGNIDSVTVLLPDNQTEVELYLDEQLTANSAAYRGIYFGGAPAGEYMFTVVDKNGNPFSISEDLTPDPIDAPAESSLLPVHNSITNGTSVDFDWEDVTGAAFYRLFLYDENLNNLIEVKTLASQFSLPAGLLRDNSLYRYRIITMRDFWENNFDNLSIVPPFDVWNSNMFLTSSTSGGTAQPTLDLNKFGVFVQKNPHPSTGAPVYWLYFMATVADGDGVPANIERVEVTFPDGTTKRLLKYFDDSEWGYNYFSTEVYGDPALIQDAANSSGRYTFRVVDFDGNEVVLFDDLPSVSDNELSWTTGTTPVDGSILYSTTPTIYWNTVPEASYYKVRIMSSYDYPTVHWSGELSTTQYTVPAGVLADGATYGYRIYAYKEPTGNEVDFVSCNHDFHATNSHFTIQGGEDLDNDGMPDTFEQQIIDDDPNDGLVTLADVLPGDDYDNDGLNNSGELLYNTDPTSPDTDNDGYDDGREVANGTDPRNPLSFDAGVPDHSTPGSSGIALSDERTRLDE